MNRITISFDENDNLKDVYEEMEKVLNGMNAAPDYEVLNYFTLRAVSCVMKINSHNSDALDLNSMS